jgi:hypothetical protein
MNVTLDEAIRIYAQASRARFGPRAVKRTQDRIEMLHKAGDLDGVRVWERVKRIIAELEECAPRNAYECEPRRCASAAAGGATTN